MKVLIFQICSEDARSCCETGTLDKRLSDDWHRGDLEQWGPRYLGNCSTKVLTVKSGLEVTLLKKGSDSLGVVTFDIEAEAAGSPKSTERFVISAVVLYIVHSTCTNDRPDHDQVLVWVIQYRRYHWSQWTRNNTADTVL